MPRRPMTPRWLVIAVACAGTVVGLSGQTGVRPEARLGWRALATPDLTIVGAPEATVRRVGLLLRRFRDAVSPILPAATRPPATPTTVVVFSDRAQLTPFATRPVSTGPYYQSGLFVAGMTSNYIFLTTGADGDFGVAYHEYVHLIVQEHFEGAPAWFHEGLAEFFRTFAIEADGRAYIGGVPANHLELLRRQGLMPLATLLEATFNSPLYQQHDTASVFYAQSWLLVHYLLVTDGGQRVPEFMTFVGQLAQGASAEQASQAAFKSGLGTLEDGLKRYLERGTFDRQWLPPPPRQGTSQSPVVGVTEADAHSLLGEALLTVRRFDAAQQEFASALEAAPGFPRAHAGYGLLLAMQGRDEEARAHLTHAAAAPDASWVTLVSYAAALYSLRPSHAMDSKDPEDASIERALRRVIALEPKRAIGYAHLARLLSLDSRRIAEAKHLVVRAKTLAPDDEEFRLIHAAVLVNGMEYVAARPVLESLVAARSLEVRQQASEILGNLEALLVQMAGRSAEDVGLVPPAVRPHGEGVPLFRELRQGEARAAGRLVGIECVPGGLVLVTRTARGPLRLSARTLTSIELLNYSGRSGKVTCGTGLQGTVVVVSFDPGSTSKGTADGRLTAIEFAPEGYTPAGM